MTWSKNHPRQRYHHGNLREALINAALKLIGEKGPAGFTFAEAARSAGVAAGTAYMHDSVDVDQVKHVLGPAMYAALARELDANNDPTAAAAEIRWAIDHAAPAVRALLRRMPARGPGRTRQDALYFELDEGMRG